MTGDRPTTPGWHCHRCRSTSCRQRADSDTDHVGRVEYRPLLLTQPSSVSWLWSHTHWCPSQRPQEVMRVDGSANPTMPKNPAQYALNIFGGAPPGASPLLYHSCEGQPRDSARQVNLTARSGFGPQAGAQRHAARRPPEARRRRFLRPHSGKIPPRSGAQRMRALRSNVAIWQ